MRLLYLLSTLLFVLTVNCSRSPLTVAWVNQKAILVEEFTNILPPKVDPGKETTVVRQQLEELINRELFVQEAESQGLDTCINYCLELEKKGLVINELFAQVSEKAPPVTEQELQHAYELLNKEVRCRVLVSQEESTSHRLYQELCRGVNFETLAVRYSIHPSRTSGGDLGYFLEYYIEEPLRSAVATLKPGEFTKPIFFDSSYQIVLLVDRRPASPPLPPFSEVKQQLREQIKLWRRRKAANEYVQNLRRRLIYNPAGLAVFYKPVDSISEEEKEVWVAVRDQKKYVKVRRLLHIARRFPNGLDTAIRTYAIKRAIEDDLMFEDGLNLGLDKLPKVRKQLERIRRKLLYETLYNRMVVNQVSLTELEVIDYYQSHRDRYPGEEFAAVAPLIRKHLLQERRKVRVEEILTDLKSRAKITVNQRVLKQMITTLAGKRS